MRDVESGLPIVNVTMSRDDSSIVFEREDGMGRRYPLETSLIAETSMVESLHWTPTDDSLVGTSVVAVTVTGEAITFELPSGDDQEQLAGRFVVYLDQNQWSLLSKASNSSSRIPEEDREAALRLVDLAHSGAVVLPASSGHYHETTKWSDDTARYRLGLTVLQLSQGWQLRDPLQVRRDEIRASYEEMFLDGPAPHAQSVVTLMPNVLHAPARGGPSIEAPPGFPPEFAAAYKALLSAYVSIDVMLDRDHLPANPPIGWAQANQEFSNWLDQQRSDSRQKRKSVDVVFLSDLQRELAEEAQSGGITAEQLSQWLRQHPTRLPALPALGLYREVLQDRHLNQALTWRPNDLTDMLYLSTAAAYTDAIVCERTMGSALERGLKRLGRTTPVFRRFRDAVPAIERMLSARAQPTEAPSR